MLVYKGQGFSHGTEQGWFELIFDKVLVQYSTLQPKQQQRKKKYAMVQNLLNPLSRGLQPEVKDVFSYNTYSQGIQY